LKGRSKRILLIRVHLQHRYLLQVLLWQSAKKASRDGKFQVGEVGLPIRRDEISVASTEVEGHHHNFLEHYLEGATIVDQKASSAGHPPGMRYSWYSIVLRVLAPASASLNSTWPF
jgi:hypothetical protein